MAGIERINEMEVNRANVRRVPSGPEGPGILWASHAVETVHPEPTEKIAIGERRSVPAESYDRSIGNEIIKFVSKAAVGDYENGELLLLKPDQSRTRVGGEISPSGVVDLGSHQEHFGRKNEIEYRFAPYRVRVEPGGEALGYHVDDGVWNRVDAQFLPSTDNRAAAVVVRHEGQVHSVGVAVEPSWLVADSAN